MSSAASQLPIRAGGATAFERRLDGLAASERGRVHAVEGGSETRRRLLEMGLCKGVEVEVLRRAPLGDPIELRVRGYLLSLRAEQAKLVLVTPSGCSVG